MANIYCYHYSITYQEKKGQGYADGSFDLNKTITSKEDYDVARKAIQDFYNIEKFTILSLTLIGEDNGN